MGFSKWLSSKESACSAGDPGLIPGLGRSPGEENGNPLQNSCLENPMDRGAWGAIVHGVTKVRHDVATKLPPLVKCILILIHLKMDQNFFKKIDIYIVFVLSPSVMSDSL